MTKEPAKDAKRNEEARLAFYEYLCVFVVAATVLVMMPVFATFALFVTVTMRRGKRIAVFLATFDFRAKRSFVRIMTTVGFFVVFFLF